MIPRHRCASTGYSARLQHCKNTRVTLTTCAQSAAVENEYCIRCIYNTYIAVQYQSFSPSVQVPVTVRALQYSTLQQSVLHLYYM